MIAPGLIIAAPSSGSGKTTVTLGVLRALRRRGLRVAAAKSGPDYIDPAFHAAASGRPALNLDAWAMRPQTLAGLAAALARDADLVVCEGAMGLFDGVDAQGTGSCADLAARTGWPVALVVDVRAMAASAGALIAGFAGHRQDVHVAGVIFNGVGSPAHAALVGAAAAAACPGVVRLGALARDRRLSLPGRHLGLVQAREHDSLDAFIEAAADRVSGAIDIDALAKLARPWAGTHDAPADIAPVPPLGQRIAVARDDAFAFAYPATLGGWRRRGAELRFFSPLADEAPAADADAVFLPGGYPELHAGRLAAGARFIEGLRRAARRGATVYGECGGYMVLGEALTDAEGNDHAMAGLLPVRTSFAARRLALGYRTVRLRGDSALGAAGTHYRGHEFHYATLAHAEPGAIPLFDAADARGAALGEVGQRVGSVYGSFIHLVDESS